MSIRDEITRIHPSDAAWPQGLSRLGSKQPSWLDVRGNTELLRERSTALFCSVRVPGRLVLDCYDLARLLGSSGETFIGGFQSALEREMLDHLLRGSANLVVALGRSLPGARIGRAWQRALETRRMLLLSPFRATLRRPDARSCELRNRVCAALASRCIIVHASSGGRVARLALELDLWGIPVRCPPHPANEDLRVLGATPLVGTAGILPVTGH